MNPRERLLNALRGEPVDRVPLALEGSDYRTRANIDVGGDPARREIAHRVFDQTHCFVGCRTGVNRYLVTPEQHIREISREDNNGEVTVTCEIDTPKGTLTAVTGRNPITNTTWTIKYPVESLEDIEKIRSVPWGVPEKVAPPDMSRLPADFGQRGITRAGISSPFVCVAGMMPYQYFLRLCATHLDLMKELTAICRDRILDILDVVLAEGTVEYVWMGGCEWVTPPMASPAIYEELVQKFEKPVIDRVHRAGALMHVHCHGNVRSTLEKVIERGGDFFEPVEPPPDGDITFAEAKELADGRITLGGNVEARVLENEDVETVEAACRAAFEGTRHRMVFQASAGPIGKVTPRMLGNYHRMIDVWEELSPVE